MNINIIAGYNEMEICVGDYSFDINDTDGEAMAVGTFASGITEFYTNDDGIEYDANNLESIILDVVDALYSVAMDGVPDIEVIVYVSRVLDSFDYDNIKMTVEF